jgi:hypothetical protein
MIRRHLDGQPFPGAAVATDPGRLARLRRHRQSGPAAAAAIRTYCVSLAIRPIPIPGRTATLLVLTTVVQIFENFRYHREFVAGSHDAALEFSANIGKWQLKGIDLIKFNASGEMIEFEVMVRPIKALQALGDEMGTRIGPELARLKAAAAAPR